MPCVNCIERCEFDKVVKECDELKHTNICLRAAYENEHRLAQKYFEQAVALQRDSGIAESAYHKVANTLEARDAELEKLRLEIDNLTRANSSIRAERDEACEQIKSLCEKYESMSNKYAKAFEDNGINLHTVSARIAEMRKENDTLRAERNKFSEAATCACTELTNLKKAHAALRSQLEGARETSKHYAEQATRYQNERDKAYEDASRKYKDYTDLMSECATLKKMKDDFCIEACHLNSALRARNALLRILFLATGIGEEMLKELFNCHFYTPDASFDEDLARRMIQHCINNNSTIIDTLTGYRFDIADRLAKAIEVRNIYGMPRKQGNADTLTPEKKPICDARHVANKKKKDVRAKPEQSQRRAKRGKAKPHQKGK